LHGFKPYREVVVRCLVGLVFVSALAAAPLSASAQVGEGVTTSKQASAASLFIGQEFLLPQFVLRANHYYYVYPGCPLGSRGGKCTEPTSAPAPTPLDEQRGSVRLLRVGVILSSILLAGGAAAIAGGVIAFDEDSTYGGFMAAMGFGSLMVIGGSVGMGISAKRLRTAKQKLKLNEKNSLGSGGVHRDPGTSRFAF
jgi:hypothetical protein